MPSLPLTAAQTPGPKTLPASGNPAPSAASEPPLIFVPQTLPSCLSGSVSLCNRFIPVPASVVGTTLTLSTPSPLQPQPFTVQCVNQNGFTNYQIIDSSAVTCTMQACQPSPISVCGVSIMVQATSQIGASVDVKIPAATLSSEAPPNLSVTASCVDSGGPAPIYQLADASAVSCNLFPCPDAKIRLCDTDIFIRGGAPMGGILHLMMPQPFVQDFFMVQCVGSEGNPPAYHLTEHDSVSCAQAATTP